MIAGKALASEEQERYSRQTCFYGEETQEALKEKRVMVLGAGGLGSPILYYLAAAGIGNVTICDFDTVALSNLNRQILHNVDRIGMNKAESAIRTLGRFNPHVRFNEIRERLGRDEILAEFRSHDLLIDATDCMENKAMTSELVLETGAPAILAILVGMAGFCFLQTPASACWRCLFTPPPLFQSGRALPFEYYPSFGPAAGLLGSCMANIAARFLLGQNDRIANRIYYISQLFSGKRLQLSSRGIAAILTGHFQQSLKSAGQTFPESNRLFDEHLIARDPHCNVCSPVSGPPHPPNAVTGK